MKSLFSLLLVVIIGTGTATFSQTVTIGTQVWMTKNLDVSTFRNGDPIPEAKTDEEWNRAYYSGKPAWCYFKNDTVNEKIYNWHVVNDSRGVAPEGFHIPTKKDWLSLEKFLGKDAGVKMMTIDGWSKCHMVGTNSSGFTGFPIGSRTTKGYFANSGLELSMWSSTGKLEDGMYEGEGEVWSAYAYSLSSCSKGEIEFRLSGNGFSIRCLKD